MVKDAVKFHTPEKCITEKILLTDGLLTAARSVHMHYQKQLADEAEGEKKKRHAEEMERKKRKQVKRSY